MRASSAVSAVSLTLRGREEEVRWRKKKKMALRNVAWSSRGSKVEKKEEKWRYVKKKKKTKITKPLLRGTHLGTCEGNLKRIALHGTKKPLVELFAQLPRHLQK